MESCQMSLYVKIPQPDEKMPHCHQQPAVKIEIPNDTGGVVFRWHPASVYVQEDDGGDLDNMMMIVVVPADISVEGVHLRHDAQHEDNDENEERDDNDGDAGD